MALTNYDGKDFVLNQTFIAQYNDTVSNLSYPQRSVVLLDINSVEVGEVIVGRINVIDTNDIVFIKKSNGKIDVTENIIFENIIAGTTVAFVGVKVKGESLGSHKLILKTPITNKYYEYKGSYTLESYEISY